MTDPRAVAAQLWCLPQHAHKEMDVEFAESIAHALADAERRGMERAAGHIEQSVSLYDGEEDRLTIGIFAKCEAAWCRAQDQVKP